MYHNKVEGYTGNRHLIDQFWVTKENSFDIYGNQILWDNYWTRDGFKYLSHFGFLRVDGAKIKEVWDERPNTREEKALLLGDSIALDLSTPVGLDGYTAIMKRYRKDLTAHELFTLHAYENFCTNYEMTKEFDRYVESLIF